MFATCLADFFNLRLWSHGQEPGYNDIRLGLEELTSATMEALTNARKNVNELTIRLYGGWHGELPESGRHILAITSAVIREFPRHVGTRLRIQIADSPIWDPSLRMVDSVKQVPIRLPDCSISHNPHCINPTNCSISILQSWWNGRCPEKLCRVRIEELGFMYRQKMVDTLLTADDITIVRDELSDILFVLCRFSYAGYIELKGRLPTGYANSPEEAYFRICHEAALVNKEYNQRKFHEALTSIQTIASLSVWLADHYGIDLKLVYSEEMANDAAFQQIFYDSAGRKKNGNFIINKFRLMRWFFIVKKHKKKVEKI